MKGDAGKAADQAVAAAAGSARDRVDQLSALAKALGGNPDHKKISTFTWDGHTGRILSQASLDGDGDLEVYGSGTAGGATSELNMFVPGTQSGGNDWSTQAASALAIATYKLNSVIDQAGSRTRGGVVNASA